MTHLTAVQEPLITTAQRSMLPSLIFDHEHDCHGAIQGAADATDVAGNLRLNELFKAVCLEPGMHVGRKII